MAATIVVSESNGAGQVVTDNISNINFGSDDLVNLTPASSPIIIGQRSFSKWLRCKLTALGGSSQIDNFRVWKSSGAFVAGESIRSTNDDTNGAGGAGRWLNVNYQTPTDASQLNPSFVSVALANPSSPNIGIDNTGIVDDSTPDTVSGSLTAAPSYTRYWAFQMLTTGSTPAGAVNQKVFTIQYDET